VTDTRSELAFRSNKSWALPDGIFTLRGRAAWAHDFDPDRAIGATFQTLPGASFVVNGAAQATDSALVTASAEKKWLNGPPPSLSRASSPTSPAATPARASCATLGDRRKRKRVDHQHSRRAGRDDGMPAGPDAAG
jgi:hypothetical protein